MTGRRPFFRPHLVFSRSASPPPAATPSRETAPSQLSPEQAQRFRDTVLPHLDCAYNFARYLTRDPTAAEDVVQEAFLRAFRGFASFRGEAPRAWLLTIVRNTFLTHAAAGRAGAAVIVGEAALADPRALEAVADPDAETAEQALIRRREAATVRETIEALPEPFRETLVLREMEKLSYKEIAALIGAPIGTVMSRLARARAMLAELLLPRLDPERAEEARR